MLRAAPRVPHLRVNSALPLAPEPDIAVVEAFYSARGVDAVVAVAPAEERQGLDEELAAAGWTAEGHTNVLVAAAALTTARDAPRPRPLPAGVEPVDPFAWPDDGVGEDVLPRTEGEPFAFAEGQLGAVLCIRSGGVAGVFRLHVAPDARRQGVGARLVAACATVAPVLYAQVEVGNDAAERLFARAGFVRSHAYHYRRARP